VLPPRQAGVLRQALLLSATWTPWCAACHGAWGLHLLALPPLVRVLRVLLVLPRPGVWRWRPKSCGRAQGGAAGPPQHSRELPALLAVLLLAPVAAPAATQTSSWAAPCAWQQRGQAAQLLLLRALPAGWCLRPHQLQRRPLSSCARAWAWRRQLLVRLVRLCCRRARQGWRSCGARFCVRLRPLLPRCTPAARARLLLCCVGGVRRRLLLFLALMQWG
jgi:hypothetical protein